MIIKKKLQYNFKITVTFKLYYPCVLKFIQEEKCDFRNMH